MAPRLLALAHPFPRLVVRRQSRAHHAGAHGGGDEEREEATVDHDALDVAPPEAREGEGGGDEGEGDEGHRAPATVGPADRHVGDEVEGGDGQRRPPLLRRAWKA
jgi:hypothetical protein